MSVIQVDRVAHIGVPVTDMERALKFYRDALGLKFQFTREVSGDHISGGVQVPDAKIQITLLEAGNTIIELLQYLNPVGRPFDRQNNDAGSMHITFTVTDIEGTYKRLQELGYSCNQAPYPSSHPEGWAWFYARDPDGMTVEFNGPIKSE